MDIEREIREDEEEKEKRKSVESRVRKRKGKMKNIEEDDEIMSGLGLSSAKPRGRPKKSHLSTIMYSVDVFNDNAKTAFPLYIELEKQLKASRKVTTNIKGGNNILNNLFFLGKSDSENKRVQNFFGIGNKVNDEALLKFEEAEQDKQHAQIKVCGEDVNKGSKITQKNKRNLRIVALKILKGKSQVEISKETSASQKTVSLVLKEWRTNQDSFINKIQPQPHCCADQIDPISNSLSQNIVSQEKYYFSRRKIREEIVSLRDQTNRHHQRDCVKKLMSALKVRSYVPKNSMTRVRTGTELQGMKISDSFMKMKFFLDDNIFIFDVTSFYLHRNNLRLWSANGIKPTIRKPTYLAGLHMMTLISKNGLEAIKFSKKHILKEDINVFFFEFFSDLRSQVSRDLTSGVVFLDNARVHDHQSLNNLGHILNVSFLFNVPANPYNNPIEGLFGLFKKDFRRSTLKATKVTADSVLSTIKSVGQATITSFIKQTILNIPN